MLNPKFGVIILIWEINYPSLFENLSANKAKLSANMASCLELHVHHSGVSAGLARGDFC